MVLQRVTRSDTSRLGKFQRTGAGAVRIPATISRTGVQAYPEQGLREYRPDSEVFAPESLASLASVPVTLAHPPEPVTPANVLQYQRGHVSDAPPEARVRLDGSPHEWVRAPLVVADAELLGMIERDDAAEVSCGYSCDLEMTPGTAPDGSQYDAIQRNIRFNHVAILTADTKARAGADARLRLDNKTMKKIVIDGVEYEYGSAEHLTKIQADHQKVLDGVKAERDALQAKLDAATARAEGLAAQVTLDALDARLEARLALFGKARPFLPEGYDTKGKTDAQVMADAVANQLGGADKLVGKTAAYIEARFDGFVEELAKNVKADVANYGPEMPATKNADPLKKQPNLDDDNDFRKSLIAKFEKGAK